MSQMKYEGKEAAIYDRDVINMHHVPVKAIIDHIRKRMPGQSIFDLSVDAGCGAGKSTRVYAPYFRSVIGFDSSEVMLAMARQNTSYDNITYVCGTEKAIPAGDNSADLITASFSVHYMDVAPFVSECKRVLKPNGCAALYGMEFADIKSPGNNLPSGIDLFRSHFIQPLRDYMLKLGPVIASFLVDRYKTVFEAISGMAKSRDDTVAADFPCTLKDLKKHYRAIPFPKEFYETFSKDSLDAFGDDLKQLWDLAGKKDEDVQLILTASAFILYLDKEP